MSKTISGKWKLTDLGQSPFTSKPSSVLCNDSYVSTNLTTGNFHFKESLYISKVTQVKKSTGAESAYTYGSYSFDNKTCYLCLKIFNSYYTGASTSTGNASYGGICFFLRSPESDSNYIRILGKFAGANNETSASLLVATGTVFASRTVGTGYSYGGSYWFNSNIADPSSLLYDYYIDFGAEPQTISDNAYNFILTAMTKVTTNVEMTSPNGVVLNTEGKYCDKNVKVTPVLEEVTVTPSTSKQTKTPSTGKAGISKVTVSAIQTEEKTVTANGDVTPSDGKYLTKVTVNVPDSTPDLEEQTITITANGTTEVTPSSGKDGLSKVTVTTNVASVSSTIEEISTAAEMNALLVAANIGKAYKFTGTSDDTYTNGDVYEVVQG